MKPAWQATSVREIGQNMSYLAEVLDLIIQKLARKHLTVFIFCFFI